MPNTTLASAYVHAIDPVILPIYGDLALRWYGLSYLAGFVIAWLMIRWMSKTGRASVSMTAIGAMMTYVIIGVLVGGRLGYVIFYEPRYLISFTSTLPFWDVLAINKGGMSSHGGMIGTIMACALFARNYRVSTMHVLDVGALVCTPGLFLGRMANFINAELWGRPLPEPMQQDAPWWSIKYPQEMHGWDVTELTRLEPIVSEVNVSRSEWNNALVLIQTMGEQAPQYARQLVDVTIYRLVEAVRVGDETVTEAIAPLLTAHYPSQILQAITDGPVLFLILALLWLKPRKPGIIGGSFLIAYGILRISTEFVRQPDEGVALLMGLSRGQVLSVVMILAGAIVVAWCARRKTEPMGGLLAARQQAIGNRQ